MSDRVAPAIDERLLLPINRLREELAALEADSFATMSDEELKQKIRIPHGGFKLTAPLFNPGTMIYRAVRVEAKPFYKARLTYPPLDRVRINGRLNRPAEAMFYGSLDQFGSCLCECRCAEGEIFAVSVWSTTKPLTLNHLGYSRETIDKVAKREVPEWAEINEDTERNALIRAWQARVFTRVVPEGAEHLYRLSIALRDFALSPIARTGPDVPDFFSGVVYPSVSMWLLADNVALLPSVVDRGLRLQEVIYLEVASIVESVRAEGGKDCAYNLRLKDFATTFRRDGRIVWNGESTALSVSPWLVATNAYRSM